MTEGTMSVAVMATPGTKVIMVLVRGVFLLVVFSLFDTPRRSASVPAITDPSALALGRADFMAVLERNPDSMRRMLGLLAKIVRRSTGHVEDLVFLDLPGRVAKCLLDISEASGTDQVE